MRLSFILFVEFLNWYWCIHDAYSNLSSNQCFNVHLSLIMKSTHIKWWESFVVFTAVNKNIECKVCLQCNLECIWIFLFFWMKIVFSNERGVLCDVTGQCLVFFFVAVNVKFWNFIHFLLFFFLSFACKNCLYNLIGIWIDPGK